MIGPSTQVQVHSVASSSTTTNSSKRPIKNKDNPFPPFSPKQAGYDPNHCSVCRRFRPIGTNLQQLGCLRQAAKRVRVLGLGESHTRKSDAEANGNLVTELWWKGDVYLGEMDVTTARHQMRYGPIQAAWKAKTWDVDASQRKEQWWENAKKMLLWVEDLLNQSVDGLLWQPKCPEDVLGLVARCNQHLQQWASETKFASLQEMQTTYDALDAPKKQKYLTTLQTDSLARGMLRLFIWHHFEETISFEERNEQMIRCLLQETEHSISKIFLIAGTLHLRRPAKENGVNDHPLIQGLLKTGLGTWAQKLIVKGQKQVEEKRGSVQKLHDALCTNNISYLMVKPRKAPSQQPASSSTQTVSLLARLKEKRARLPQLSYDVYPRLRQILDLYEHWSDCTHRRTTSPHIYLYQQTLQLLSLQLVATITQASKQSQMIQEFEPSTHNSNHCTACAQFHPIRISGSDHQCVEQAALEVKILFLSERPGAVGDRQVIQEWIQHHVNEKTTILVESSLPPLVLQSQHNAHIQTWQAPTQTMDPRTRQLQSHLMQSGKLLLELSRDHEKGKISLEQAIEKGVTMFQKPPFLDKKWHCQDTPSNLARDVYKSLPIFFLMFSKYWLEACQSTSKHYAVQKTQTLRQCTETMANEAMRALQAGAQRVIVVGDQSHLNEPTWALWHYERAFCLHSIVSKKASYAVLFPKPVMPFAPPTPVLQSKQEKSSQCLWDGLIRHLDQFAQTNRGVNEESFALSYLRKLQIAIDLLNTMARSSLPS